MGESIRQAPNPGGFWTIRRAGADEATAVLTFTRPPANWMSLVAMTELVDRLEELAEAAPEVRVVMITGGVDGYFVAHADLDDLKVLSEGGIPEGDLSAWSRALDLIESMPQPVVAAIDGQAWGGGCELSLACTMRVGSQRAHMGQPEVNVGIIPGAGGTQRLPRLVGLGRGAELCLSGRIVEAEEAERMGLLNAVLPTNGFVDHAIDWCGLVARNPAGAIFAAKRAVVDGRRLPLDEGLRLEGRLFLEVNASDEARSANASIVRPEDGGDSRLVID